MDQQQTAFMGQISAAKKEAHELRRAMKDAARLATLTFPSLQAPHRQPPKHKSEKEGRA